MCKITPIIVEIWLWQIQSASIFHSFLPQFSLGKRIYIWEFSGCNSRTDFSSVFPFPFLPASIPSPSATSDFRSANFRRKDRRRRRKVKLSFSQSFARIQSRWVRFSRVTSANIVNSPRMFLGNPTLSPPRIQVLPTPLLLRFFLEILS